MKRLNLNELLVGFLVPFVACVYWIGWWSIPVCAATAILWALGGAYGHSIRVWGVPALLCGSVGLTHQSWVASFPYFLMVGALSIGYGIPSTQPPDEGSALGRFWWNSRFVRGFYYSETREMWTNFLTRGTIYTLFFAPSLLWVLVKIK